MRPEIKRIREGLRARDPAICGTAPRWIIEQVESRFDEMLAGLTAENGATKIEAFARGAIRYIDDQCGGECDTLGDTLFSLVTKRE
jgi:hypothetical protein